MFKQFTRHLQRKTSQVLRALAEKLDQPSPQEPNPVAPPEDPWLATTPDLQEDLAQATIPPVLIENSGNGDLHITDTTTSKTIVVSRPLATTDQDIPPSDAQISEKLDNYSRLPRRERRRRNSGLGASLSQLQTNLAIWSQQPRFWFMTGLGFGAGCTVSAFGMGIYILETMTQEQVEDVATYAPPGTLTIKANNGQILQEIGPVSHDQLSADSIPTLIEQAFIASEDRRFWQHHGVDPQGIARALLSNVQAGELVEGASTITQQLTRLVFLSQERTLDRKIREIRLAQKIEAKFPKKQILERYLNLVYLGSGAYGVADASWAYFSKAPEKLTLGEAATLAGVVPAPSLYSPLVNLAIATTRRNEVLMKMSEAGFISRSQAQTAIAEPLVLKPTPLKRFQRTAPFFSDYILKEVRDKVPEAQLNAGGVMVMTTLNPTWQTEAEKILQSSVKQYGGWQGFSEGALVSLDPRTGAIKAMVGGSDYAATQFNRVTQAQRQPGSTFKPILYATAIAAGISPNKSYLNVPFTVNGYTPENYGDRYSGGFMSLREALTNSVNVVAVRLLLDVGWNPVIETARKMGIQSKIEPTYSLALGAWEMTPLEMTSAYGTFANRGVHVSPYAIQQVLDRRGNPIYKAKHQQQVALDPDSNAIMTSLMRSVVTSGTGRPAQLGDRQVAGKTGTSDEAKDLWFIGYTPQLVTGVWLGNDNSKPTRGASTTAAIIWGKFMGKATKAMRVEYFPPLPKRLEGRKPTIQAEPIKRRRITVLAYPSAPAVGPNPSPDTTPERPRRRRRRRVARQDPAASTPRRRLTARRTPQAQPNPPASTAEMPAPPASYKSE